MSREIETKASNDNAPKRDGWHVAVTRHALAYAFVMAAGAVAMMMAWGAGADTPRRVIMVAIVGAGLALLALAPHLTIGRGRYLAAVCLAPLWICVVAYNGLSALEFFDRHLADADARRQSDVKRYANAKADYDNLRARRDAISTLRSVETIEADIDRRGVSRSDRDKLIVELAEARSRDGLDAHIADAKRAMDGVSATATADTGRYLKPMFPWLSATVGVTIATMADLRAICLLLIVELGAATVPLAMALAGRPAGVLRAKLSAMAAPVSDAQPIQPLAADREDVRDIMMWLDSRTIRSPAGRCKASALHADYSAWCESRGQTPATTSRFGIVLTETCGLAKRKAGGDWTMTYLGIDLKQATAPRSRVLAGLAIVSGKAA